MPSFHRIKKEIGLAVLERDKWQCTICGSRKNLCVHHVKRMNPDNKNYNNIANLSVVCRNCHMSLHRKAGHIMTPIHHKGGNIWARGNKWGRRGRGNPPVICQIDGCNIPQHAKGLCKKHYAQKYRNCQGW